jgi:hypothetical protein
MEQQINIAIIDRDNCIRNHSKHSSCKTLVNNITSVHIPTSKSPTISTVRPTSLPASTTGIESALPTSTKASSAYKDKSKQIGIITGVFAGSIVGAMVLGLLIHWLYARYSGVNISNCFGNCCKRRNKDHQNNVAQPPIMLFPISGIGAALHINDTPRPLAPAPRVAEIHISRVQRKVTGSRATRVK